MKLPWFGPRVEEDAQDESAKADELRRTLVKHRLTLQAVNAVLSDSQAHVATAIDETGVALARLHAHNRGRR